MNLKATVDDELSSLRTKSVSVLLSMPEESHRNIERTWRCRKSVSVYVEPIASGEVRLIVKAFESRFPHFSTNAFADGVRVGADGSVRELSEEDKATLY